MKKRFFAIFIIIATIATFCSCTNHKQHPELDGKFKNMSYEFVQDGQFWNSNLGPDIIDINIRNCTEDSWSENTECLNAIRDACQASSAGSRIKSETVKDEVIFRIINDENENFYIEYNPAEATLWTENNQKDNCFLDITNGALPPDGITVITKNENGSYIGGALIVDGETITMWQSGTCFATWKCHIDEPSKAIVLDKDGLFIFDSTGEIVYEFAKTDDGLLSQRIVAENVIATDMASFGKKEAYIYVCESDGKIVAYDDYGSERNISTSYTEVKWPFILENNVWYIAHCELKVLQDDEKDLPYIKTAIGTDEQDGYAKRTINAWFDESKDSSWREEWLENLHF